MSVKQRRLEKHEKRRLAVEQISKIFEEARKLSQEKADLHVHKARRMAQRANIRLPRELKRRYCKHCYAHLKTGTNARIRTREGTLIIYCYACKKYTKQGLRAKKKNSDKHL